MPVTATGCERVDVCFTGFPFLTAQSDSYVLLKERLRSRERGLALNPLPPTRMVTELGLDPRFPSLPLTPHFHTEGLQPDSGPHWGTVC